MQSDRRVRFTEGDRALPPRIDDIPVPEGWTVSHWSEWDPATRSRVRLTDQEAQDMLDQVRPLRPKSLIREQ